MELNKPEPAHGSTTDWTVLVVLLFDHGLFKVILITEYIKHINNINTKMHLLLLRKNKDDTIQSLTSRLVVSHDDVISVSGVNQLKTNLGKKSFHDLFFYLL